MRNPMQCANVYRKGLLVAVAVLVTAGWTGAAFAQPGGGGGRGGGPQISKEDLAAVFTLQAKGVATELGLNEENTGKLVAAYEASRASHRTAMEAMRGPEGGPGDGPGGGGPGGGRERWEAMTKANKAESDKLAAAVGAFLTPEQTKQAVAVLGTYSRQWDRMVHILAGFKLDAEKGQKAFSLVAKFVAEGEAARAAAMASGDPRSVRDKMMAMKEKLDADLAGVLSPEQAAKWKEETARRGGRDGGRGPGGPGGPGGGPEGGPRGGGDPDGQQL
ncbi:MAG: hypothetical protein HYV27_14820 [Candidatus Hydrogenedentes bacterium]|nr:hypothetical protein [Candidatus Hydrogenedentota bacterium]